MDTCVYDKTDKGREEIATRKHHLQARLRTLLVMVNGKSPVAQVLSGVAGLGIDRSGIDELVAGGFIAPVGASTPEAGEEADDTERKAVRRAPPRRPVLASF